MKVILSKEAKSDMDNIYKYIARESIKYAIENDKAIRTNIHKLEFYPYSGRYIPEFSNKKYRQIIFNHYRIFYEVIEEKECVYIHFIVHGKRNFKSFYNSYINNN